MDQLTKGNSQASYLSKAPNGDSAMHLALGNQKCLRQETSQHREESKEHVKVDRVSVSSRSFLMPTLRARRYALNLHSILTELLAEPPAELPE